ncbi:MAG: hypothetical protein HFH98_09270 [Lachnospiraceae bacterium]|nr:hypothetical protein [Lachnospiraceae bacterium]
MRTTLHMLHEQSPTQMMSYILQTRTGKLVVIDGAKTSRFLNSRPAWSTE